MISFASCKAPHYQKFPVYVKPSLSWVEDGYPVIFLEYWNILINSRNNLNIFYFMWLAKSNILFMNLFLHGEEALFLKIILPNNEILSNFLSYFVNVSVWGQFLTTTTLYSGTLWYDSVLCLSEITQNINNSFQPLLYMTNNWMWNHEEI